MFSSGDSGYEDAGHRGGPSISDQIQVDYPTSSPWVTSVGGTSVAIGKRNNWEWEIPWGTLLDPLSADGTSWTLHASAAYGTTPRLSYDGSGGGGVSTAYTQPFYQRGVVPNSLATAVPEGSTTTPMRVVPDVSALADPSTGMLVGQTTLQPNGKTYAFSLSRIGGTSVASPTFAGIEADAQQAAGRDIGFANPAIYARYGTGAFHDVTESPTRAIRGPEQLHGPGHGDRPARDVPAGDGGQWRRRCGAAPRRPGTTTRPASGHRDWYIQSFSRH